MKTLSPREAALTTEVARLRKLLAEANQRNEVADHRANIVGQPGLYAGLRTSEGRLRLILESATDFAILATDLDGRITEWNNGACNILGWDEAEILGQDARVIWTPEDREAGIPELEMRLAREEGRAADERWHMRRDGSRFWATGELMPMQDEVDCLVGYLKIVRDRTEQHFAGEVLATVNERFRLTQRATRDAIWDWSLANNSVLWNEALEEAYGWHPDKVEPTGNWWIAQIHPEDRERINRSIHAVVDGTETSWSDGYRFRRADGTYAEVLDRGSVIRDPEGRAVRMIGAMLDRSRIRTAEAALRTGEQRFRTILDTIDTAFAIVQVRFDADDRPVDYRFVEANPAFERQAGINLQGKWVTEFAPDLERFWFDTYGHVARTGEPATFENYAEAFGRWFDVRAVRVGDPAERQIAILFTDITARRVAEDRLRASEALARENVERVQLALAAGAIIGTWHWDIPSDRITVDEAFAYAFGLDPTLGRKGISLTQIVATVHPDDQAGLVAVINQAIAHDNSYAHQYRMRRTDGRYHWIEANGRVNRAADGTPQSFPGVLIDVDARRAVEAERDRVTAELRTLTETLEQRVSERTAELLLAEEQLRQSQKMEAVGQLTGGVAHDFNNLLTIIRSSVDFLRRPGLPEERRKRYVEAVSDTVERAAKLTRQLLAFARRQALTPEVFDVGAKLHSVGEMLDTVTGSRIRLVIEGPERPCFVCADVSQFETALVNMAVNARDAMNGEGRLTLHLEASLPLPGIRGHAASQNHFVAVSVIDTGSGIPADQLPRIFEPFFTTKEVGKGTGLGLSQVFGFTKQSGGDVDVRSTVGEGTTFTLYLPEEKTGTVDMKVAEAAPFLTPGGAGRCVLVVEDNVDVGQFCTQILEDLGYRTTWAVNAEEALVKLGADGNGFDAVFSDVVMPGMGGVALAETLRERLPDLPVVLASGYSHVLAREADHGFELLHKPYSAEQVGQTLLRVIAKSAAAQSNGAAS